jgi:hypothetical protein
MMIEAVPLGRWQRYNHLQTHWLGASQGARTAAAVAATGYSFASRPVANEGDLHREAKKSCRVIEVGQMEAMDEFDFGQQVQALEAQRTVQRMGKRLHQVDYEHGLNEQEERGK